MDLPNDPSESFKRRNPHLYPVSGLQNPVAEHGAVQALDRSPKARPRGKGRVVVRITIVGIRNRLLDSDNFIAGAKSLRDSIARSLACDDADPRIAWDYGQVKGTPKGTIVLLSKV